MTGPAFTGLGERALRVLVVHGGDRGSGGGETQMLRLQAGLRERGADVRILCRARTREDSVELPRRDAAERILRKLTSRLGLNDIHCVSAFALPGIDAYRAADILDFHCLHRNFFSYLALPKLTGDKPSVLTLHDMWPFTGHCYFSQECQRWRTGCGQCPQLDTEPALARDGTGWAWRLKRWAYARSRLTVVAPSAWLARLAEQSILGHFPVHHIPHGIDTHTFRPLNPEQCRLLLGIPPEKKVLLFAAESLANRVKGADLLVRALRGLRASLRAQLFLLLMGRKGDALAKLIELPALALGFLASNAVKVIAYSAAHLFVSPTRADNFPLVLLESLACGTPVVSYRVGGVPEVVRPGVTGYLAEPESPDALGKGIEALLDDDLNLEGMRANSRSLILGEYSLSRQVDAYVQLYRGAMAGAPPEGAQPRLATSRALRSVMLTAGVALGPIVQKVVSLFPAERAIAGIA